MRIRHIKGAEETVAAHPLVISDPAQHKGSWKQEVFGNDHPLYLEIGTGMGTFIRESAVAHPEINYIGLEMNSTVLLKAIQRYEKKVREEEGAGAESEIKAEAAKTEAEAGAEAEVEVEKPAYVLRNLRFIDSDARLLEEYFAPGEVDRIYLNFSDPWPKKKNANKRLTSPMFLERYRKVLAKDARIEFKTDNRGLFDYSVETAKEQGWTFHTLTYDLHHDPVLCAGNIMTEYEAKFSAKGNLIGKMVISRQEQETQEG